MEANHLFLASSVKQIAHSFVQIFLLFLKFGHYFSLQKVNAHCKHPKSMIFFLISLLKAPGKVLGDSISINCYF